MTKAQWAQALVVAALAAVGTAVGTVMVMRSEISTLNERTTDLKSRIERIEAGFLKFANAAHNLGPNQRVVISTTDDGEIDFHKIELTRSGTWAHEVVPRPDDPPPPNDEDLKGYQGGDRAVDP